MFIAYYIFEVGHQERHYIKNPRGKTYNSTATRDPKQARRFATANSAEAAVRGVLERAAKPGFILGVEQI